MRSDFRHRARVTRRLTVPATGAVTVDATVGAWFDVLALPVEAADDTDGGPRATRPRRQLFYTTTGLRPGPADLAAGSRVDIEVRGETTVAWEVLGPSPPVRVGSDIEALEATVMRVTDLYPSVADVKDTGGQTMQAAVPCAVWQTTGAAEQPRGEVAAWDGEAPPEHHAVLSAPNRRLHVGAQPLRIAQAVLHRPVPRVAMTLREATAG